MNRQLAVLDNILNKVSTRLCLPMLPGRVKDGIAKIVKCKKIENQKEELNTRNIGGELEHFMDMCKIAKEKFEQDQVVSFEVRFEIEEYQRLIDKHQRFNQLRGEQSKSYFYNILDPRQHQYETNRFVSLGKSLESAIREISGIPTMEFCGGGIYLSPPVKKIKKSEGSQKWHIDRYSLQHIKVFINLEDVNNELGPTYIVPKKQTTYLLNWSWTRCLMRKENKIKNQKGGLNIEKSRFEKVRGAIQSSTGLAKSALIVNTGQCLHCGSNNYSGKTRKILLLHYCVWQRYIEKQKCDYSLGVKMRFI